MWIALLFAMLAAGVGLVFGLVMLYACASMEREAERIGLVGSEPVSAVHSGPIDGSDSATRFQATRGRSLGAAKPWGALLARKRVLAHRPRWR